jgi:hypothetical protein
MQSLMAQKALIGMAHFPRFEGAAHHDIKFNVTVRCTFKLDFTQIFYKYLSALHLKIL